MELLVILILNCVALWWSDYAAHRDVIKRGRREHKVGAITTAEKRK
jgi:hypothetical protein